MPSLRHDDILLRLIKDVNDIRANLRRVVANLPLYDIANENTPAQLTTNQNNYVPGNYDILMLSSSQNIIITGVANGVKGRRLQLYNVGNNSIFLPYENPLSLSQNRFRFQNGLPASLEPGTNILLYYYSTSQRWIAGDVPDYVSFPWTVRTIPAGNWKSVAWSPSLNLFVAVGWGGTNYIATSSDGVVWVAQTTPAQFWNSVIWVEDWGLFIACSRVTTGSTTNIITSPDGFNWTTRTTPAPAFAVSVVNTSGWNGLAYSDTLGRVVSVGHYTDSLSSIRPLAMSSDNGSLWTDRVSGVPAGACLATDVVWADAISKFVSSDLSRIANYSSNGITWTQPSVTSAGLISISWSPSLGLLVAVDNGTNQAYISTDAINWTQKTNYFAQNKITWSPELGIFMMVGTNSAYFSGDGLSVTATATTPSGTFNSVAWSPSLSRFVAVGNSVCITSP